MFFKSNKFRKGAGRAAVLLATTALLATGVAPAHASDATPLFLSFEDGDTLGAAAANQEFEGAGAEIADSTNLTGKALKFTKSGQPWGGVNAILSPATAAHLADATLHTITFDYWSNDTVASPVMVALETSVPSWQGGPKTMKTVEAQPGLNQLSFDMSTGTGWNDSTEWATLVIFPNFGADDTTYTGAAAVPVSGQFYEIDNISVNGGTIADVVVGGGGGSGPAATSTLVTFESDDTLGAAAATGGFEGASTEITDAVAGGNGGKALKIVKAGNAWSGANLFTAPSGLKFLDATHTSVTLNYFSPETVNTPVQFQLSGGGSVINQAVEAVPGWQKLTFDFSASYNDAKEYTSAVIFPNFVNSGDVPGYTGAAAAAVNGQSYYVDNIAFNGATTPAISVARTATSTLLTFEDSDALGALAAGDATAEKAQGGFEGLSTSIADAPTGGNGGKVLKMVKNTGAQTYAGVNLVKFAADTRVTDATHAVVTMNYYSAKANSTVRLEVRPYPAALGLDVTATKVGWQTLTFDFTNVAGWTGTEEFVGLTLFPDFNVAGANTTYYVDAVAFNGATTPALPAPVVAVKPAVRVGASVSGTAKVGNTLTAVKGSWTGTATIAYTYKWYRCTVIARTATSAVSPRCSVISGATSSTYKVASADLGKYVRVLVIAKNSKGYAYSLSKSTTVKVVK